MFTVVVRDSMLNSLVGLPAVAVATHASLHSNIPDASGSNELIGGSPAYARKPINFNPASGGRLYKAASPAVQFDVPAGSSVAFVGLWSSPTGGAFLGYAPIGSDAPNVGVLTASSDKVYAPGYAMNANDRVLIMPFTGMSTPPGLPPGIYYCDPAGASEFKLRAVLGGPTIDASADGPVVFQRIRVDTFSAQGTLAIANLVLGLDG